MMTARYWDRLIPARWPRLLCAALLFAVAAYPQNLSVLVRNYRSKPTPAKRTALLQYAVRHAKTPTGALAQFALGVSEFEDQSWKSAAKRLGSLGSQLPLLRDYSASYAAAAWLAEGNPAEALRWASEAYQIRPASPATARAILTAGSALLKLERPREAAELVRASLSELPAPRSLALLAEAWEAAGEDAAAAAAHQRVYYEHPLSPEAEASGKALERLKKRLGSGFPPPMPQAMMSRAEKLMEARAYAKAREEYAAIANQVAGMERDLARVRIGACDYRAGRTADALRYLRSFEIPGTEADAERLYWIVACARRLEDDEILRTALERLEKSYPQSHWRAEALLTAANGALLKGDAQTYLPLYRACAEIAPGLPTGATCHWKVAWHAYIGRSNAAEALLREHITVFPASEHASAALYYLGRLEESRSNIGAAKGLFAEVESRYPNSYYGMLARQRLQQRSLAQATAAAPGWLASVAFPNRPRRLDFTGDGSAKYRRERAQWLASAGLDDLAEAELRFGIEHGEPAPPLVLQLARIAGEKGAPDQGIRYIRSYMPGYLWLDPASTPREFWLQAFPLPFRAALEKWANHNGLDAFLIAGLVRQESEFNPKAVSPAGARGLTQILPRTGRSLARRAGIARFQTGMLHQPEINLRLGALYFKELLREHGGLVEHALASYNAGKSRTEVWKTQNHYQEPSEFIESIPFSETRNYVQIVLRNADTYRRLYAGVKATAASSAAPSGKTPAAAAARPSPHRPRSGDSKRRRQGVYMK